MNLSSVPMTKKTSKMRNRSTECGNALIYIFVGIALFGALMFLFSRGSSQSTGGFTNQKSIVQAQAVISYGDAVATGVNKLISKGISENDISFETDVYKAADDSILNPASKFPNCTNDACKVFNRAGGGVIAQIPADLGGLPPSSPTYFPYPGGLISHVINIPEVGTPEPELVLTFHTIPLDVCIAINNLLNNNFTTNPPLGDNTQATDDYSGSFSGSHTNIGDGNDAWAEGKTSYCYQLRNMSDPNMYAYQKVAIVR